LSQAIFKFYYQASYVIVTNFTGCRKTIAYWYDSLNQPAIGFFYEFPFLSGNKIYSF